MFNRVLTGIKDEMMFAFMAAISLALLASYNELAFTTALMIVISSKIYLNMSTTIRRAMPVETGSFRI